MIVKQEIVGQPSSYKKDTSHAFPIWRLHSRHKAYVKAMSFIIKFVLAAKEVKFGGLGRFLLISNTLQASS